MKLFLALALTLPLLLLAATDPAHAREHDARWQNSFSLEYTVLLGDTGGFGARGSWFFHKYFGVSGMFTKLNNYYTSGLFLKTRFMYKGLVFGLFAGPEYGTMYLSRDLGLDERENYTSRGLFLQAGPFVGYRFASGVNLTFSLHKFFGVHTTESVDGNDNSGTMMSLSAGIQFSSLGTIIGAGRLPSLASSFAEEHSNAGDPNTSSLWNNRFTISVGAGTGTPMGHFFGEVAYALVPEVEIGLGGGWGTAGPAVGGMLRYRSLCKHLGCFMYIGTGASWGTQAEILFRQNHPVGKEDFVINNAMYANIEVGYGWRNDIGATIRFFAGISTMLNPSSGECINNCTHISAGGTEVPTRDTGKFNRVYPYIGVAIGPSF